MNNGQLWAGLIGPISQRRDGIFDNGLEPRKTDSFCDMIIKEMASGRHRSGPPFSLLVAHLVSRGRLAYDLNRGFVYRSFVRKWGFCPACNDG